MQEIGRAGRDGKESEACLFYNMNDIGANTNVKPEIREFCLLDSCRRKFTCEHFGTSDFVPVRVAHTCCDICSKVCNCDECLEHAMDLCNVDITSQENTSDITKDVSVSLIEILTAYFEAENMAVETPNPALYSGLTNNLASRIICQYQGLNSENDIQASFPFLDKHYVQNIWKMLSFTKMRNK